MKKLKLILLLSVVSLGFACEAQAGLNFEVIFGGGHRHRHHDNEVRYYAPPARYYDDSYEVNYRPRRRIVRYYQEPVYYSEDRQYYRRDRYDDYRRNNRCD